MPAMLENLFHRANRCPFACFLKVLLSLCVIYAIHIAIFHLLLALVGVIASLAVAFHRSCWLNNADPNDKLTHH